MEEPNYDKKKTNSCALACTFFLMWQWHCTDSYFTSNNRNARKTENWSWGIFDNRHRAESIQKWSRRVLYEKNDRRSIVWRNSMKRYRQRKNEALVCTTSHTRLWSSVVKPRRQLSWKSFVVQIAFAAPTDCKFSAEKFFFLTCQLPDMCERRDLWKCHPVRSRIEMLCQLNHRPPRSRSTWLNTRSSPTV